MILNSGQHTQPDPQSCRVRSLGGRRGGSPKTNNVSRDQNKTEQRKRKHRKSIPPALSQRNQHLTHAMLRKPATTTPKQHGALAKTGDMQAGLETFNQQPCSPESCHSVTLAKVLLFGKAAPFFAKKVTAAISFSGP